MPTPNQFDLFIFGSTSQLIQQLMTEHKEWFKTHVRKLIIVQRTQDYPEVYRDFSPVIYTADCANTQQFRQTLDQIVSEHATPDFPMQVFPTYGVFSWNFAKSHPVFSHRDDSLQVNLNARLQIIDAFKPYYANTRFHLFGSLFANFPYTGNYALSMWYINQLPKNPEYQHLDMIIYNLGGMKTRFWDYKAGGENNPFVFDQIPMDTIFEYGFAKHRSGVYTFFPTLISRIACFLGSKGIRVL